MQATDAAYEFARMFDTLTAPGGTIREIEPFVAVAHHLRTLLRLMRDDSSSDTVAVGVDFITRVLGERTVRPGSTLESRRHEFCEVVRHRVRSPRDLATFALVCDRFIAPMNAALNTVPDDETALCKPVAKALLDRKGAEALAQVIELWDDLGRRGCIRIERDQVVECFRTLRHYLADEDNLDLEDTDIVLTAFAQEFERRLGQKRKGRAGRSLESLTSFVLDHFGIPSAAAPEHFTSGLEIDNWVRGRDRWYVGISCKRTLRERWKQAFTDDTALLDRHHIRALWHVMTYTRDLSDAKITEMGTHRAILFVPNASDLYRRAAQHPGLSPYVRPLESFIPMLKAHVSGKETP